MTHLDHDELYDLTFRCCVAAVKQAFPHLPLRDIMNPPKNQFDAILSRQIVQHLMVARFGLTKAGAGRYFDRKRVSVNRAMDVVDARLEEPDFEAAYRQMADRALSMFDDEQMEAA